MIGLLLAVVLPLTGGVSAFDRNLAVEYVNVTNGVKWIDGRALPIEGRAFDDVEHYYDRLPRAEAGMVTALAGSVLFSPVTSEPTCASSPRISRFCGTSPD